MFNRTWTILPGNKIFAIKVDPLNLESQKQAKNIPVSLPSSQINQNLRQIGPGVPDLWSDKQTDRQKENITLYISYALRFGDTIP